MCHNAPKERANNTRAVQIPATQPLLLLATCQRSPKQLPPVLLRFFQTQSALVTSAHKHPNSTCCVPLAAGSTTASDTHDKQASPPHGSSCISSTSTSRVIVVDCQAASSSSWQEAIHRTAEAAATVVASAAASVFHSQLLERIRTAASQTGLTMAVQNWGRPRGSSAVAEVGQEQGWVRIASDSGRAVAELQAETQHQKGSEPPASGHLAGASGHLATASGHLETAPGQLTAGGVDRSAIQRRQAAVNKNDLQKGLKLHAEVGSSLSKPYWHSFSPWQHHAIASANLSAAWACFSHDHVTASPSCSYQVPFCSKSISHCFIRCPGLSA